MKLKYRFVYQTLGDIVLAITVGADAEKFSRVIRLNETGCDIMRQLEQETTPQQVLDRMLEEYDVQEDVMQNAVDMLIDQLDKQGLIE